jgi:two-component system, NtrC family, sensor kinase
VWQSERLATVGKLTAGLAHEINNPLGVILCYANLLRQTITDAQQKADLEIIERHTRQAQRVLQDLLNFARPKAAGSGIADACAVAASMIEVFSVQAGKKGVHLYLEVPSESLSVRIGMGELEQVISNLVMNALDAVDPQIGKIHVSVEEQADGMIAIKVADNGPGVTLADVPYIFDPFFSTKEIGSGTGLGLTVLYAMVTDVGGMVTVERSAQLGGALFVVVLPAADQQPTDELANAVTRP